MCLRMQRRLADDRGIAMVIVVLAVMIVTLLGASLFVSSTRDLDSSVSVQRASSALGIAEAGVQHAIQVLKVLGPTSVNISKLVKDESCAPIPAIPACSDSQTPGQGRWMLADNPQTPEREDSLPPNPNDRYVGNVGTGLYRAYIVTINPIKPPKIREGVYKVVSVGFDRRDRPARPGERTVEQFVKVELVDLPFGLFSKSDVDIGGTPKVLNESLWTTGNVKFRSNVAFEAPSPPEADCQFPQGCDLFYGWDSSSSMCSTSPAGSSRCPTAVHATGTIYAGNGKGNEANQGPIHPAPYPAGYQSCSFPYDRDSLGGPYSPPGWRVGIGCSDSAPAPPYSSSEIRSAKEDFPFDTGGPKEDVYQFMKQMAQSTGTFCTHSSSSGIGIGATGQPNSPHPCERIGLNSVPRGFFVLYVEATTGAGSVGIKTGWGTQSVNPDQVPCDPDGNFGVIIVRNTNLDWQNNQTWWGAAFIPEGEFRGTGTGSGGWFVGTIFAKSIGATGNMKIQLNDCWVRDIAGPWFAITRLRWHESDR